MGSEHRGTRIACVTVEDCHKIEQDKKLLKDSVCVKIKMCTALQYKDINCRRGRAVRGWQTWTQGVGGLMEREGCGWGWVSLGFHCYFAVFYFMDWIMDITGFLILFYPSIYMCRLLKTK